MNRLYSAIGRYAILMSSVFSRPEKGKVYRRLILDELMKIGVQSLGIVALLSLFMGAVVTLQTAANIDSGWIPKWTIGFTARQTMILEFSSTMVCLILSGKVGSNIASEIGTMRITEQIDALDIMGVNSASYLILPKIIAAVFIFPFIVIISMVLGIAAGALVGSASGAISLTDFEYGLQYYFDPFDIIYTLIKCVVFAFIITSVSAYHGYNTRGGALEVGQSSTRAVVSSIILIMIFNYMLTQLLLL
ncbi:MAG: ABC transporter permease [Crocinitomicaceae bacterium]|nr:ABC transporter permease [Crocinitomicaceae bacterium]